MMVTPSVKLVRPLGEGGMGAVWVADHLALRTQVVVKFIASGLKSNKEAQDRFSREAAAASQVKSPHVVQTFDHGVTDEGVPYIVMELLEGRDLGQYLEQESSGRMQPDLAVEVLGQLARALDRAHERGIIHRDIKPGNIYLCDAGRSGEVFVKLLDFGIAKGVELPKVDSGTKTGSMIGSPFYMSPEQILGSKDLDHRSDLWSVGVVCFEMLTGRKPFDAETMGGLAIRIHSEPLPLPTVLNPDLPIAVDAWFSRACARDVAARYASAKEMTEELAVALGGQMPKSLDVSPRLTDASARAAGKHVNPIAATLAAGSATDAGVVRSATQGRSRSRLLVLLAIFVIVPLTTFVVFRTLFKRETPATGSALVSPDPSGSGHADGRGAGAGASASASAGASAGAGAGAVPSAGSGTGTGTGAGAGTGSAVASAEPAPVIGKAPPHATHRPAGIHAASTSTSTSPPTTPPTTTLASPPVTSPTTPRPATSGHDIF